MKSLRVTAFVGLVVLSGCGGGGNAPTAKGDDARFVQMVNASPQYAAVADQFITRAQAGDEQAMLAMVSPTVLRQTGEDEVRRFFRDSVIPFFAGRQIADRQTVAGATDNNGHSGFAYYRFAVDQQGGNPKPFAVYIVDEGGKLVVSSITVNQFVPGRHG